MGLYCGRELAVTCTGWGADDFTIESGRGRYYPTTPRLVWYYEAWSIQWLLGRTNLNAECT